MVAAYHATSQKALQGHQNLPVARMLHDHKLRKDLIADRHLRVRIDADVEAAFRVNKSDHPVCTKFHTLLQSGYLAYGL
jgi:hypothetical protein